jgi:tRNA dimethylallyltransferase
VLVGGSGLYLEAVLDGFSTEDDTDRHLRAVLKERMEKDGVASLYGELGRMDPLAQARLAPADTQRVLRALELAHGKCAGRPSRRGETGRGPLSCIPLVFCLRTERNRLYQRIDRRVDGMLESGLVDEVSRLAAAGHDRDTPAMGTMGYREILEYLAGECSLQAAADRIKARTRHYAKRQVTWFRRDRRVRWLDLDRWGEAGAVQRILAQVRSRGLKSAFAVDS